MNQVKAVFQGDFDLLENIKISPLSRGYTFSDGIYEVVPFHNNIPIAFDEHIMRFKKSANAMSIVLDEAKVIDEMSQLIDMCDGNNGYVYYQISRGIDEIRSHIHKTNLEPEYFGYSLNYDFEDKKFKVLLCEDIRWGRCDIKSTSLLANTLMMNNAASKGCNEIIMHKDGIITEAGASNVFFIIDDAICTPSLNNNILPGITRDMSIKIFRKNNINVFEDNFSIEQLLSASKVWLTSSTKGMAEVTDVYSENHSIKSENPLFNKCEDIFRTAFFNG